MLCSHINMNICAMTDAVNHIASVSSHNMMPNTLVITKPHVIFTYERQIEGTKIFRIFLMTPKVWILPHLVCLILFIQKKGGTFFYRKVLYSLKFLFFFPSLSSDLEVSFWPEFRIWQRPRLTSTRVFKINWFSLDVFLSSIHLEDSNPFLFQVLELLSTLDGFFFPLYSMMQFKCLAAEVHSIPIWFCHLDCSCISTAEPFRF